MKILSIGNSFSADAHVYLHALANQRGIILDTVNAAIGGCSLQMHWDNIVNKGTSYLHNINGGEEWEKDLISIEQALTSDTFDAVTVQQVSGFSGIYESYKPYINDIISFIRKYQPSAQLYLHRTWAYEIDSAHSDFFRYEQDQIKMFKAICEATNKISAEIGVPLILSGDVIQALREHLPEFDYQNGGESLCRDGFHLSVYARYAVALTWLATLTNTPIKPMPFMELDFNVIKKICRVVNEAVFQK